MGVLTSKCSGDFELLRAGQLGDASFNETHGTKFTYIGGAMANGIATTEMVVAFASIGAIGFFGSAGLQLSEVKAAISELKSRLSSEGLPWGINLIHTPDTPAFEDQLVDLYLANEVNRVSASAYMKLTPAVVRFACSGLTEDRHCNVVRKNYLFAKVSRPETASLFMSPAPKDILKDLVDRGQLTVEEADLAQRVPLADDITVEADSGGHTDRQILTAVFPTILSLRERLRKRYSYSRPLRVGAAGGLGDPRAIAAAYAMGAAYVLTGTVNQACVESGLGDRGRQLLAQASVGDLMMAPSSDMFEAGIRLQVLKYGSMFPMRAQRLYDLYKEFESWEQIPPTTRAEVEQTIFRSSFDDTWEATSVFWSQRDLAQVELARTNPKHQMALTFRSYLGQSSKWAIQDNTTRQMDYQIWCGPAIAAFNDWTKGSFLEGYADRNIKQVTLNLLQGASALLGAYCSQKSWLASDPSNFNYEPRVIENEL